MNKHTPGVKVVLNPINLPNSYYFSEVFVMARINDTYIKYYYVISLLFP